MLAGLLFDALSIRRQNKTRHRQEQNRNKNKTKQGTKQDTDLELVELVGWAAWRVGTKTRHRP